MTTGERIQKARKAAKLSQKELGEKLGVSASMIGQYENNLRNPKTETLMRIAEALNVNPRELWDGIFFFEDSIFLGSDIIVETEDGVYVTVSSDTREGIMFSRFQALNELGKDEAIKYADLLLESNKYRKKPID